MMLATLLSLVLSTVQWERDALVADAAEAGLSSRRQAEDLRVITETIPDALVVMDRDGTVLLHNHAARRWLAASGDVAGRAGCCWPAAASPPRRPRAAAAGAALPARARRRDGARPGRRGRRPGTGQARLVSVDAVPLHDSITAQPDRALLVLRDVTDEHRRLDDVEAAHARTERLIADAPHGVAVLDMRGRILQVNASLASLTGRSVDALVGRGFEDLAPDHRADIVEHLHRAVDAPGSRVVGEWTMPGPGHEDVHVATTSRVISSPDAEDDVILVNVVDLSERRRYEQRLAHLADHDVLTGLPNRRRFDAALGRAPRPVRPVRPARRPAAARPRPLQGGQRHPRARRRRRAHRVDGGRAARLAARGPTSSRGSGATSSPSCCRTPTAGAPSGWRSVVVERVRANSRTLEGVNRRVTASIGVVTFAAAHERAEDVLALADMLMYDAKDAGRDRFAVLDDSRSVQPRSGARMEWKAASRRRSRERRLRAATCSRCCTSTPAGSPGPRR